jgi:putative tricarboxylic transport membrane protein
MPWEEFGMMLIEWNSIIEALLYGTMLGMLFGLTPGLGGRTGVLLALPLTFHFEPYSGAVFLFALHSVIHTASSIPAIALGLPLSSADAATIQDGYPLTKMGRGAEALGASLTASVLGGIIGATAFIIAVPLVRPIVTNFGPPEIMLLAIFGFVMIASLSAEGLLQGIAVGMMGIAIALVGEEKLLGYERFTFGFDAVSNGFKITALVCGLFAFPEMLDKRNSLTDTEPPDISQISIRKVMVGMLLALRYKFLIFRSSVYGILIGLTPSVGASVAVWLAYDYAVQNVHSEIPYGKGAITGVIAPEAANNAKEGGAMLPSLLLGIPGSSSMAIIMGGLGIIGISVGPNMLNRDLSLSYILGATVITSNVLAIVPFLCIVPFIVYLARLKRETLKPIIIVSAISAALINSPTLATIIAIALSGFLGAVLTRLSWPRTPLVLGFIIAPMLEGTSHLTIILFGWSVFGRPLFVVLLILLGVFLYNTLSKKKQFRIFGSKSETVFLSLLFLSVFVVMTISALSMPKDISLFPIGIFLIAIVSLLLIIALSIRQEDSEKSPDWIQHIFPTGLLIASIPIFGLPFSGVIYIFYMLRKARSGRTSAALIAVAAILAQIGVLALVYDLLVEREIVGRICWRLLGY